MYSGFLFLLVFLCSLAVVCLLREPIRKYPWVFYLLAVAVVVLYFAQAALGLPRSVGKFLTFTMRRGFLAVALFVIVMFIGVLPKGSKARKWIQPLRGPISIVACILALGHVVDYIMQYGPQIFGVMPVKTNVIIGFWGGVALFALLLVLGVTSFNFIKRHMTGKLWKQVQWFAYVFYALAYIHLCTMLLPAAFAGRPNAIVSIVIYSVFFLGYLAARIVAQRKDRQAGLESVLTDEVVGAEAAAE